MHLIRLATLEDLDSIFHLFDQVKLGLRAIGLDQWPDSYPMRSVVARDIVNQEVHLMKRGGLLLGTMTLNQEEAEEYKAIDWPTSCESAFVIHRLVVAPECWGQGLGKAWMKFAEDAVREQGGGVIRLDTYEKNKASMALYKGLGYQLAKGKCFFYGPQKAFVCYEKVIA